MNSSNFTTIKYFFMVLFGYIVPSSAQLASNNWRALIVYSNAVDAAESNMNMYENRFVGMFDEINDIYAASGIDARANIAGVIWDKNYIGGDWFDGISDIAFGTGGIDECVDLMDEYAADILILRDVENPSTVTSGVAMYLTSSWYYNSTTMPSAQTLGYGGFWVDNDDAVTWAHEAGHIHDLYHCNGFRQTHDGSGNYTETSAVTGFNTVMSYVWGNTECSGDGQDGFPTVQTFTFSDPGLTWQHPTTSVTYNLGNSTHNSVATHNANDNTIRNFSNTPSALMVSDDMDLEQWDYADFLAINSVDIESGFSVERGARLNITVGTGVMQKRGVKESERFVPDKDDVLAKVGATSNFLTSYDQDTKIFSIAFDNEAAVGIDLDLFNVKGVGKDHLGSFRLPAKGKFSHTFSLSRFPSDTYFVRISIGAERIYKKIYRR